MLSTQGHSLATQFNKQFVVVKLYLNIFWVNKKVLILQIALVSFKSIILIFAFQNFLFFQNELLDLLDTNIFLSIFLAQKPDHFWKQFIVLL